MGCSIAAGAAERNNAGDQPTAEHAAADHAAADRAAGDRATGPVHEAVVPHPALDRSGHTRRGKASFYARMFAGRKMADGTIMEPQGDNAASKTLPLGTTARVTNLENGRSAVVTIRDRGPYIQGRIVDLSPSTAKAIGLEKKKGVAKVEVAPIVVPLPDGHVKLGAAVTESEQMGRFALLTENPTHRSDTALPDFANTRDLADTRAEH